MRPALLSLTEAATVDRIIVADSDAPEVLRQDLIEHRTVPPTPVQQDGVGERREDPGVAALGRDLPAGLVDVDDRRPGHQLTQGIELPLPESGELTEQGIRLGLREVEPTEEGQQRPGLVD